MRVSIKHCGIIFALALLTRLVFIFGTRLYERPFRVEVDHIAISASQGNGFSDPFRCTTGATAIYPPVYPAMLAASYKIFGTGKGGELAKDILNSVIVSIAFALLPLVAVQLGFNPRVSLIAAAFGSLVPLYIYSEVRGGDVGLITIFVELLIVLTCRRAASQDWRIGNGFKDGLLWGIGLLVGSSLASVLASCGLFCLYRGRLRATRYLASLVPGILLMLLPWAVRNQMAMGGAVPLRSNLWLELQVSNNQLAGIVATQNQSSGVYAQFHPYSSKLACAEMAKLGELNYMASKRDAFLSYVRNHPGRFVRMTLVRAVAFWFPPPLRLLQAILAWLISCLAAIGAWRSFRNNRLTAQLLGLVWLCFPLTYYLVAIDSRYRYPIYWSLLLMAGVALEAGWAWLSGRSKPVAEASARNALTGPSVQPRINGGNSRPEQPASVGTERVR